MLARAIVLLLLLVVASCASRTTEPSAPPRNACPSAEPVATKVRRLTGVEYNNTVRDLFAGIELSRSTMLVDLPVHGFENAASSLNPSAVLVEQHIDAATAIAHEVRAQLSRVVPCAVKKPKPGCAMELITKLGKRAFRRPLTAEERERYGAFFAAQLKAVGFHGAAELTVQALLQSPQFLYRVEQGSRLTDYERASRLSYFLWQSMPDDVLLAAADAGKLRTKAEIEAQARRMLADPRAVDTVVDFHRQWLSFDRVMDQNKDFASYPKWDDKLRDAMRQESDRFVAHVYKQGGDTLSKLLTSRTTFVNARLAEFYGVPFKGEDWQQIELAPDQRAGILTRGGFLAGNAHATNGSPPLRGVAVLDRLLCNPPPPPPAGADTSPPKNTGPAPRTNRALFAERTSPASCNVCHEEIDGIGYSFEGYDGMGSYRTTDSGQPVDTTGHLENTDVDGPVNGAIELSAKLAGSGQVRACMVQNWFRFAFAREPKKADECVLEGYQSALKKSGGDVRALLVAIASSDAFLGAR